MRALPYTVAYNGADDCQRVFDQPQRGAFESEGESLFGPFGAPHGQGTGGRDHKGWRGAGGVWDGAVVGRGATGVLLARRKASQPGAGPPSGLDTYAPRDTVDLIS